MNKFIDKNFISKLAHTNIKKKRNNKYMENSPRTLLNLFLYLSLYSWIPGQPANLLTHSFKLWKKLKKENTENFPYWISFFRSFSLSSFISYFLSFSYWISFFISDSWIPGQPVNILTHSFKLFKNERKKRRHFSLSL